jgi:hypothetical protein
MAIDFTPIGNSTVVAANTSSGNTRVAITRGANAPAIGCFMIDNLDTGNVVIVNIGYSNTIQANQGTGNASTASGFAVSAYATKYITLPASQFNQNPQATVYVAANAVSGTADVMITPIYLAN